MYQSLSLRHSTLESSLKPITWLKSDWGSLRELLSLVTIALHVLQKRDFVGLFWVNFSGISPVTHGKEE